MDTSKVNKKILVLGHNGMLGHAVFKYFTYHTDYEIFTCDFRAPSSDFVNFLRSTFKSYRVVINCMGAIPQKTDDFSINYELPQFLTRLYLSSYRYMCCTPPLIIHPTTDCEFSSQPYSGDFWKASDEPCPDDDYGKSKVIGSRAILDNCVGYVIRSSIIGLSNGRNGVSLLDWAMPRLRLDCEIKGYLGSQWNGITVLEWAKIAHHVIDNENWMTKKRLLQVSTEPISKYHLLLKFQRIFELGGKIDKEVSPYIPRWLRNDFEYTNRIPFIDYQLKEYKRFYESEGRYIFPEQEWS